MLLAAIACCAPSSGPTAPHSSANAPSSPVLHWYPFAMGFVWSYTLFDYDSNASFLVVQRVSELTPTHATIVSSGEPKSYRIAPDGLVRESSNTYVFRVPVVLHEQWIGAGGASVEVTSVDRAVKVPAGTFTSCIEVTESLPDERQHTVFCPDVGPVLIENDVRTQLGFEPAGHVELRSYGPPAELK
jgi:hypothetical protein